MPLSMNSIVRETLETVNIQINVTQSEKNRVVIWIACQRIGVQDGVLIKTT